VEDKERNSDETDEVLSNQVKESSDMGLFTLNQEEVTQSICSEISGLKNSPNTKLERNKYLGGRKH